MKITIVMQTGNEAFYDMQDVGAAIITVGQRLLDGKAPNFVMDVNGNKVGTIVYEPDEDEDDDNE